MEISIEDVKRFTRGDCHLLAIALHKKTGWPIKIVEPYPGRRNHAIVETPCGNYLDVQGLWDSESVLRNWTEKSDLVGQYRDSGVEVKGSILGLDTNLDTFKRLWGGAHGGRYSYLRAYWIAEELIRQYHSNFWGHLTLKKRAA